MVEKEKDSSFSCSTRYITVEDSSSSSSNNTLSMDENQKSFMLFGQCIKIIDPMPPLKKDGNEDSSSTRGKQSPSFMDLRSSEYNDEPAGPLTSDCDNRKILFDSMGLHSSSSLEKYNDQEPKSDIDLELRLGPTPPAKKRRSSTEIGLKNKEKVFFTAAAADHHHQEDSAWEVNKVMTKSDVDRSSTILIGKDMVSRHILPHVKNACLDESDSSIDLELRLGPPVTNKKRKIKFTAAAADDDDDHHHHQEDSSWKTNKVLTKSDVDHCSRLLIGIGMVSRHILPHLQNACLDEMSRGIQLVVWDVDTGSGHTLTLKRGKKNSYVFGGGWKSGFVDRRNLKENDEIGMRWDDDNSRLEFMLIRRAKH